MRIRLATSPLAVPLTLLVAALAVTRAASAAPPTPVADLYVQTSKGVNVYTVNAAGQLALLAGSPFAQVGQMEAVNGGHFLISVGTDYLHSYKIEPNGAVGGQLSVINTASYGGGDCGTTEGPSLLDHTGQYFSVALAGNFNCSALQTYKVAVNGEFTFLGDAMSTNGSESGVPPVQVFTYSSNDLLAYGFQSLEGATIPLGYKRGMAGDLMEDPNFAETGPKPNPSDNTPYAPVRMAADPASHLAAVMNQPFGANPYSDFELASFTIDNSTGALNSTNTYANMPTLQVYPTSIGMSWSGTLVAVGGTTGLQVFHFNGASSATADGGVLLPNVEVDQVAWDKNNHLFALSYSTGKLYVFTAASDGTMEPAGSPYNVPGAYGWTGMIVVPE